MAYEGKTKVVLIDQYDKSYETGPRVWALQHIPRIGDLIQPFDSGSKFKVIEVNHILNEQLHVIEIKVNR
tara:strand:+ start:14960 stop:15169 length:210 start_codon:yes stop_codon:yes gene_type:complete